MLRKKYILGVGITDETQDNILEYILQGLKKPGEKYYVVTPNPEIITYTFKHPEFKKILNNARLALADGIGVIWAGKILGKKFSEKVTGTDLLEKLCSSVAGQPITVGFLGGRGKIAEKTAECLVKKYPGLKVVFAAAEWPGAEVALAGPANGAVLGNENFLVPHSQTARHANSENFVPSPRLNNLTIEQFNNRTIDLLFVAYGFPKQEEWMSANLSKIPVKVAIGVGGAFDYISGSVPRAPVFIRTMGFEWLFRLLVQPWRIKRQLALLEFVWLVLKEKLYRA
ncbi:MAG: WecB/TagA/CpsF family glycosyltransferase [bacterium]|nr:WecB/TagA/CpsF family glycosyltransferase [bacterium]